MKYPMLFYFWICISLLCGKAFAQHHITIEATLNTKEHLLEIRQKISYHNTSKQVLDTVYFLDWANAFSDKTTPLAKRFSENFKSNFHFESSQKRGKTIIHSISDSTYKDIHWQRLPAVDILKAVPSKPIQPGERFDFNFVYEVQLPDAKFTRFGYLKNGDYQLRYWCITPAVFTKEWQYYSHKNLNDFYIEPAHFNIKLKTPDNFHLTTDFEIINEIKEHGFNTSWLKGKHQKFTTLYLQQKNDFEIVRTPKLEIHTSIDDKGLYPPLKTIQIDRILNYLENQLGPYPFKKMVISNEDYKLNPAYGLNQLPNFIRPFPDGFQYDIEQLKTITGIYLKNTLHINPRKEHWFYSGLQIYLIKKYTELYYPNMKIVGNLSKVWGLRWLHGAQLDFNDQYSFLYLNASRLNLDQPLAMARDSLIKFNAEIASGYKAGVGFNYLNQYLGDETLSKSIKEFYSNNLLKQATTNDFKNLIASKTNKPIQWFFDDYVGSNKKIDYKIKKIKKVDDTLHVTIKNNSNHKMPFPLFGLHKKNVILKQWQKGFDSIKTFKYPAGSLDRFAIDYNQIIPEFNKRNNYKKTTGLFKKPVQFRLLQDVEDPEYDQLFVIPIFEYNLYDGFTMGPRMYNKAVLPKNFLFKIDPLYGFTSNTLIGGASLRYSKDFQNQGLYFINLGSSYSRFSYNKNLFYNKLNLWGSLAFREKNLRSNKRRLFKIRNIGVKRDLNLNVVIPEDPNYNVLNVGYSYSNINLINHLTYTFDYEYSTNFQKLYTTIEYRKLFLSNRQLNLRFFAGTFLNNKDRSGSNFFSFALDRPTDYLFDYNYYGRSEDTGLFSQQLIVAEGGFKSRFETAFANQWMTTFNASTNLWRWILVYGDVGLVNNRDLGTQAFFDSGIRLNLVTDYFELYFPMYSSNGWEPGLERYNQKIRFVVTLNPQTLFKLFTRRWY